VQKDFFSFVDSTAIVPVPDTLRLASKKEEFVQGFDFLAGSLRLFGVKFSLEKLLD
jgi:hypothetical protein